MISSLLLDLLPHLPSHQAKAQHAMGKFENEKVVSLNLNIHSSTGPNQRTLPDLQQVHHRRFVILPLDFLCILPGHL